MLFSAYWRLCCSSVPFKPCAHLVNEVKWSFMWLTKALRFICSFWLIWLAFHLCNVSSTKSLTDLPTVVVKSWLKLCTTVRFWVGVCIHSYHIKTPVGQLAHPYITRVSICPWNAALLVHYMPPRLALKGFPKDQQDLWCSNTMRKCLTL